MTNELLFTEEQRRTLHVLAWLFLRMNEPERAGRVYTVLVEANSADRMACAGLAAVQLLRDDGDAAKALALLDNALAGAALPTREAGLHLMRAQALWKTGRTEEARDAVATYRHVAGAAGRL